MRPLNRKMSQNSSKDIQIPCQSSINININSRQSLQQQLKRLKSISIKKQQQGMTKQRMYRIQVLKNQKIKDDIVQIDKQFDISKKRMAIEIYQKNKNNKQSPMFYNQNGLCPFELMLFNDKRFQQSQAGLICMICFQDIQMNQITIDLPCTHTFHKQCSVQHLLGSKFCPCCSQFVNVVDYTKNIIKMDVLKK